MRKTVKKLVDVTEDIICDACGSSAIPEFIKKNDLDRESFNGSGVLQASYGYGSNQDGKSYHFDLCEACFGELVTNIERIKARAP